MNRYVTNFLAADSDFFTGAGSVFNLAGSYYRFNSSRTPEIADATALFMDWAVTGQDIRNAMASFARENKKQLKFSFAK